MLLVQSQKEFAYEQIKNMIFHMELLPGARISELQIAKKLSISRTPVHDALRYLEAEGLVTIEANRGASVKSFCEEEVQEIGVVRLSLDILSIQLAAYYGSAADFDHLNALADICEAIAAKGDIYGRIQTDCDFHLAITKISNNSLLFRQQHALYQQIHLIQISKYTDIAHSLLQIHHHKPIVAAIRTGNIEEATALLCQHYKNFHQINPYVLKCNGYTSE
ncbi:GntR family transcriptional regulator [Anaerotignum sp.]|uniref:GntR family transcriptional regulator n=1 Tax=Anaerotignum sp. TaxID=2039241 RepID=UPI00289C4649|nr:GntR family transcriptional regulator [Anaerotignum sp.]MCQ4936535.1 GntR family transcriptional regulator [Anaerotignum propionicum]